VIPLVRTPLECSLLFCCCFLLRTEGGPGPRDLFSRQGLLGGTKVPLLVGGPVISAAYDEGGSGVLIFSECMLHVLLVCFNATLFYSNLSSLHLLGDGGKSGVPTTESMDQVKTLPYAARYVRCGGPMNAQCRTLGYNGVCWIDRPDVTPVKKQKNPMPGRAK
jgi:hypothetical protein